MKSCAKCGFNNEDDAKFCNKCGTIIDNTISNNPNKYSFNAQYHQREDIVNILLNNFNLLALVIGIVISYIVSNVTYNNMWGLILGSLVSGLFITGKGRGPLIQGTLMGIINTLIIYILNTSSGYNYNFPYLLNDYMTTILWYCIIGYITTAIILGIIFVFIGWLIRKSIKSDTITY